MQFRKTIMKTTKFTCLALLILTLPAARGEPFRTDINPALLYYQAFLLAPRRCPRPTATICSQTDWQEQKLPERFGEIVAGYDNEFKLVREAAQQKVPCDWGIDMSRRSGHISSASGPRQGGGPSGAVARDVGFAAWQSDRRAR